MKPKKFLITIIFFQNENIISAFRGRVKALNKREALSQIISEREIESIVSQKISLKIKVKQL